MFLKDRNYERRGPMGWESFDYVGLSVSEQIWTN